MAAKSNSRSPRPGARQATRRPAPRPTPAAPLPTPSRVAVATAPALARLGRLPKAVLPILVALGVVSGLALGGIAGLAIVLAVVGVLGWLLAAFWPMLPTSGRVIRVGALTALLAIAVIQV